MAEAMEHVIEQQRLIYKLHHHRRLTYSAFFEHITRISIEIFKEKTIQKKRRQQQQTYAM